MGGVSADAGTFAAVGFALYAAHMVGDHWVQTDSEAGNKGKTGEQRWTGRYFAVRHGVGLAAVKAGFVAVVWAVFGLSLAPLGVALGMTVDTVSHIWADRRHTLAAFARRVGKGTWWERDPNAPYLLDQSWHIGWLFVAAVVIAGVGS